VQASVESGRAEGPGTCIAPVIPAYADGAVGAFSDLYRRFYPQVVTYVASRGIDRALAEDVAQDTLMAAAKYFDTYDTNRPVWPWLRRIAGHVLAQRQAAADRELPVSDPPDRYVPGADEFFEGVHCRATLRKAMAVLSPRCRDALWLRYGEDRVGHEAAALLGITANAFDQLIWRAKRMLRDELGRIGTGVGAAVAALPAAVARLVRKRLGRPGAMRRPIGMALRLAPVTGLVFLGGVPLLIGLAPGHTSDAGGAAARAIAAAQPVGHIPTDRLQSLGGSAATGTRALATHRGSGDTVITASQGPVTANADIAKNPIRNGDQSAVWITVVTPLGNDWTVGLKTWGTSGRLVCQVVSCDPRPVAAGH